MMLRGLLSAPATMAHHAGLYITVWGVVFLQGMITLFLPDALGFIEQAAFLTPDSVIGNIFPILVSLGIITLQFALSLFLYAHVARITTASPASKFSLFAQSVALAILFLLVGGSAIALGSFLLGLTQSLSGILLLLVGALLFALILLLFGGLAFFGFTPGFMGRGLSVRDALAESWHFATRHAIEVVLLFLLLLFIGGLIDTITTLITDTLSNEWILLGVNSSIAALFVFYSATVLAHATPEKAPATSGPRHTRTKR